MHDDVDREYVPGEEVEVVRRKPRAGVVVSARLTAEEADLLEARAAQRGWSLSQITRDAIAYYLRGSDIAISWTATSARGDVSASNVGVPTRGTVREFDLTPAI
jgi:hypothetical protein